MRTSILVVAMLLCSVAGFCICFLTTSSWVDGSVNTESPPAVNEIEWTRVPQGEVPGTHWMYVCRVPDGWLVQAIPRGGDDAANSTQLIYVPDARHRWLDIQ